MHDLTFCTLRARSVAKMASPSDATLKSSRWPPGAPRIADLPGPDRLMVAIAGLEPSAVESLVSARADVPAAEAKQAVAECRDVYAQRKGLPPAKGTASKAPDYDALIQALAPL
jgi:hypothetical protein